jgi:hypothetical protein
MGMSLYKDWTAQDHYNFRKQAMSSRWQDALRQAMNRPYVQMMAVGDIDPPQCRAMDMVVVRIDNPWLLDHLPPHDEECRCFFRTLSDSQMVRGGFTVTPDDALPV